MNDQSCKRTPTSGLLQVGPHPVVVREHGGCGSDLCSHVADGGHSFIQHHTTKKKNVKELGLTVLGKKTWTNNLFIYLFFLNRPVQEMESTPGPWYSTMAPVPPFTVKIPATFKMTSLGDVQPDRVPVSFTPITFEESWGGKK